MSVRRVADPLLKQMGTVTALKEIAKLADGRETPESQIEWLLNVGFLAPHPRNRGEFCLTERGCSMVWLWWKCVDEGQRHALAERIVLPGGPE